MYKIIPRPEENTSDNFLCDCSICSHLISLLIHIMPSQTFDSVEGMKSKTYVYFFCGVTLSMLNHTKCWVSSKHNWCVIYIRDNNLNALSNFTGFIVRNCTSVNFSDWEDLAYHLLTLMAKLFVENHFAIISRSSSILTLASSPDFIIMVRLQILLFHFH